MKISKHNFAKAFWHHHIFLSRAQHLTFPTCLLCYSVFPSLFSTHFFCVKVAFGFIFYCLGPDPTPGGARMGFFNTWRGCPLPCTVSWRSPLQGVGAAGLRSRRLTSYTRSALAGLASNCGLCLASTEEVEDKGKNSWDLIACATSDKLQSPKEAAIDLYLYLSLCNLGVAFI